MVPRSTALAMPALTRSWIIARSNSAKNTEHLKHRLAGQRSSVETLLVQIKIDLECVQLRQETDEILQTTAETRGSASRDRRAARGLRTP